ncbi:MAG: guanylate kinase [Oscillospiraceae bacterium]|nr:guanylate kinase [Oscillospiraceae bacterium]
MKQGRVIIISGPSGVGKGTVVKRIMAADPELCFSVSATTRAIRPGEVDGVSYYFISRERFEEMIQKGEFLEHASYAGNYYGTPEPAVNAALAQGKSVVLEIEVQGALQVMRRRPDAVSIFIAPPSFEELHRRLAGRGDTDPESMARRLREAKGECELAKEYNYTVINDSLEEAVQKVQAILTAERCRSRYTYIPQKEE